MKYGLVRTLAASLCGRDDGAVLARRDVLAGIGLAGLLLAAPKVLLPGVAEAKSLDPVAEPETGAAQASEAGSAEHRAEGSTDVAELSARRRWRRRYYGRRRYWRHRYWRRRRFWRRRRYWY
jgi:hypothetical protein